MIQEPGAKVQVLTPNAKKTLEIHAKATKLTLSGTLRVINADELVDGTEMKPHLELFDDDIGTYFFSVDLKFRGEYIQRALFAGQLMGIAAPNLNTAKQLAADGLLSTVNLMYEEMITRPQREMQTDLGGEGLLLDMHGNKITSDKPIDKAFGAKLTDMLSDKSTKH
jgi:hypothetical protein